MANVTFDAVNAATGFNGTSFNLTVSSNATVIAVCRGSNMTGATLAGVAGTLLGTFGSSSIYYWTGVTSGSKVFVLYSTGNYCVAAVASYLNVASIDTSSYATTTSSTSASLSLSRTDAIISCYDKGSGTVISAAVGSQRAALQNGDGTAGVALIDGLGVSGSTSTTGTNATASGSIRLVGNGIPKVAYQAASSGARVTGTGNASTTHTCPVSDAETIAIVGVVGSINSTGTYTPSVTYGGTAMTLWGTQENLDATTGVSVRLYYLLNPGTGAKTVTVTHSGTATRTSTMISSVSYTSVLGVATPYTGTPTSGSTTRLGCLGDEILVGLCSSAASISSFSGTSRYSGGGSVSGEGDYCILGDMVGTSASSWGSSGGLTISGTNIRLAMGRLIAAGKATYVPFTDTFTTAIAARWNGMQNMNGTGTYGVTDGHLQASSGGGVVIYDSTPYDARTSDVYIQAAPLSASSYMIGIAWIIGENALCRLEISGGVLQYYTTATDPTGNTTPTAIALYNASTDGWLRIASTGGTTTLYTSPNGATWTSRASFSTQPGMAGAYVAMYSITYDTTVWTDNFCTLGNNTNFFQMWP